MTKRDKVLLKGGLVSLVFYSLVDRFVTFDTNDGIGKIFTKFGLVLAVAIILGFSILHLADKAKEKE